MRRMLLLLAAAAVLVVPAALAKGSYPETIPLPNGFQPEGIAIGKGNTFYVGSIPTGAIYVGDLRSGTGKVAIQGAAGRAATGLAYDRGRLWVSGASTGKAFVYDARSGALIREYQLATGADPSFVNDVVVTKRAAYFTDSSRPVLYKVALSKHGAPGAASTIALKGDYEHLTGFNLNGIDATPNGKTLVVVQSANGRLYAVDPKTGAARTVDLGGAAAHERRRDPARGQDAVRRPEPRQQDRGREAHARLRPRNGRTHDHRPGFRRADDHRAPRQDALRRQRAVRHRERARCGVRRGAGGMTQACERPAMPPVNR